MNNPMTAAASTTRYRNRNQMIRRGRHLPGTYRERNATTTNTSGREREKESATTPIPSTKAGSIRRRRSHRAGGLTAIRSPSDSRGRPRMHRLPNPAGLPYPSNGADGDHRIQPGFPMAKTCTAMSVGSVSMAVVYLFRLAISKEISAASCSLSGGRKGASRRPT